MPASRRRRLGVRIGEDVWRDEVERLNANSRARLAAESERSRLERDGVALEQLLACADLGEDGTRLQGLVKVYVPINDAPPSARLFAFVLSAVERDGSVYLRVVAFGARHPPRGTRIVYERAHKRRECRYPDQ